MRPRLIIDCFTFFNELKLLEFRLAENFDFIDYFILVESTKTFSGKDKPLYYQNNKHLFERYRHKIIHVIVDDVDMPEKSDDGIHDTIGDYPNDDNWNRERFQRNSIMKGLKKLDLRPDDIILINDVDEILSGPILQFFKYEGVFGLYVPVLDTYIYNLKYKIVHNWPPPRIACGTRAVDYQSLLDIGTPDKVRNTYLYNREYYPNGEVNDRQYAWLIPKAGWHFSYFGDKELIIDKIKSYSHQENNKDEIIKNIDDYINSGRFVTDDYFSKYIDIVSNVDLPINYKILL